MMGSGHTPLRPSAIFAPLSHSSSPGKSVVHGNGPTSDVNLANIKHAAKFIDEKLYYDRSYPDLSTLFQNPSSKNYVSPLGGAPVLERRRILPFPEWSFCKQDSLQCTMLMGMFPEIERFWMSIDDKLFIWDYDNPEDYAVIEDTDGQVIDTVGFTRPLPGVFNDDCEFVIVVATKLAVKLFGVHFEKLGSRRGLGLLSTDMAVPADNVTMAKIVGMQSGRIFMMGANHHIYEFLYQSDEGWLHDRCRKINRTQRSAWWLPSFFNMMPSHGALFSEVDVIDLPSNQPADHLTTFTIDESRNLFYGLSQNDSIVVFDLGKDGKDFLSTDAVYRNFMNDYQAKKNQATDDTGNFKIVAIHPVLVTESKDVHLVAISANGTRYYFSLSNFAYGNTPVTAQMDNLRPISNLRLVHIRDPPPRPQSLDFVPGANAPISIGHTYFSDGVFLAHNARNEEGEMDEIITVNVESGMTMKSVQNWGLAGAGMEQGQPRLVELSAKMTIEDPCWGLFEACYDVPPTPGEYMTHECSAQYRFASRRFFVLTYPGVLVYEKLRPVEYLIRLFSDVGPNIGNQPRINSQEYWNSFTQMYGHDECAAMCLGIACSDPVLVKDESLRKSDYLIGEAQRYFRDFTGQPYISNAIIPSTIDSLGIPQSQTKIVFSSRHEAMYLYFARLVKPIWKHFVFKKETLVPGGKEKVVATLMHEDIFSLRNKLSSLAGFLKKFSGFSQTSRTDYSFNAGAYGNPTVVDPNALNQEHSSVQNLMSMLHQVIEALSFVKLLMDGRVSEIVSSIKSEEKDKMVSLTYETLITSEQGRAYAKTLITAYVNKKIGESQDIEELTQLLRHNCPSFYTPEDVIMHKATELLERTLKYTGPEASPALHEALRLFKMVANLFTKDQLSDVMNKLVDLRFHVGAADLALAVAAHNVDNSYNNNSAAEEFRNDIYGLVIQILGNINGYLNSARDGRIELDFGLVDEHVINDLRQAVMEPCLRSQDQTFHCYLYTWLIDNGLIQQLLDVKSPFIEDYLLSARGEPTRRDLLWKYYVRQKEHRKAATQLRSIAWTEDSTLALSKRIEYLSSALSNIKSTSGTGAQDDSTELETQVEEELEVATVQVEVLKGFERILSSSRSVDTEAISQCIFMLNSRLFNITELYNDFCKPAELHECALLVFRTAGFQDTATIRDTYVLLFDQVAASVGDMPQAKCMALKNKVSDLARRHREDAIIFPVRYIVNELEKRNLFFECSNDWVIDGLMEGGVSMGSIFEAYHLIFESKTAPWAEPKNLKVLLSQILYLLDIWIQKILSDKYERREEQNVPFIHIQTALDKYLQVAQREEEFESRIVGLQRTVESMIEGRL